MTATNQGRVSTRRAKRFRQRQKGECTRMEARLSPKASRRLKRLVATGKVSGPATRSRHGPRTEGKRKIGYRRQARLPDFLFSLYENRPGKPTVFSRGMKGHAGNPAAKCIASV